MYEYRADVLSVYDADTLRLRVDLGMDTSTKTSLRLNGIDAYEITGTEKPQGEAAKDFTLRWLRDHCVEVGGNRQVIVQTIKDRREKYGYRASISLRVTILFFEEIGDIHYHCGCLCG